MTNNVFMIGDKVKFNSNSGKELTGVIVKVNAKTYKILVKNLLEASLEENEPVKFNYRWITKHKEKHMLERV